MYKIVSSSFLLIDLSFEFERNKTRREVDLSNTAGNPVLKNFRRNFNLKIHLKVVFGLADYQETGTYELSYKLTLGRKTDDDAIIITVPMLT